MDATFGHEADEVHPATRRLTVSTNYASRHPGDLVIFDGGVDARQVLHHHTSRPKVHVTDFGVAHLAVRQSDIPAGGGHEAVGRLSQSRSKTGVLASRTALSGDASRCPQPSITQSMTGRRPLISISVDMC